MSAASEQPEITVKESFEELKSEFTDPTLERVTIDTVALLRLVKNSMDSQPDVSKATLLGFDIGTTLEITNCYPNLPSIIEKTEKGEDEAEGSEDSLLDTIHRCYKDANIDIIEVGWYTTSYGDNVFLMPETIEEQFTLQMVNPKSVMLVFDPFRTMLNGAAGTDTLALHAYRLSAEFLELYKTNKFTMESIIEHKVSYRHIFEEIPIFVRPAFPSAIGSLLQRAEVEPQFQSDRCILDTTISPLMERTLELLVNKFDQMEASQTRFANFQRALNVLQRRFKSGQEVQGPLLQPTQLDSLLLTSQMTSFCDQTLEAAADSTAKLYFVNDILKGKK